MSGVNTGRSILVGVNEFVANRLPQGFESRPVGGLLGQANRAIATSVRRTDCVGASFGCWSRKSQARGRRGLASIAAHYRIQPRWHTLVPVGRVRASLQDRPRSLSVVVQGAKASRFSAGIQRPSSSTFTVRRRFTSHCVVRKDVRGTLAVDSVFASSKRKPTTPTVVKQPGNSKPLTGTSNGFVAEPVGDSPRTLDPQPSESTGVT